MGCALRPRILATGRAKTNERNMQHMKYLGVGSLQPVTFGTLIGSDSGVLFTISKLAWHQWPRYLRPSYLMIYFTGWGVPSRNANTPDHKNAGPE